jgi:hypothetical protein
MEMFVVVPSAKGAHEVQNWVIEPSNGMSDPARFAARNRVRRRFLKQDDDLFRSVVCGYGMFGIAVSYVLDVRDFYWLDERWTETSWGQIKDRIPEIAETPGARDSSPSNQTKLYVHIAKALRDGGMLDSTPCRIDEWTEQAVETQPAGWRRVWPPERAGGQFNGIGQGISGATFDITGTPSGTNSSLLSSQFFKNKSQDFFKGGFEKSAYYRSIRRLRDASLAVDQRDPSNPVDNTTARGGEPSTNDFAITCEIAVAIDDVAAVVEAAVAQVVNDNINLLTPVGIRFTAPSQHYLCPTAGRETAFIEFSGWLPSNRQGRWASYRATYRTTLRNLIREVRNVVPDARLHLGKFNIDNASRFASDYPNFDQWIDMYALLNATGIWDCPNSQRWQLDDAAPNYSLAEARSRLLAI